MTSYYVIKIRKDLAKALPIVILILILAFFAGRSLLHWNPATETPPQKTTEDTPNTTPPKTNLPPTEFGCESFQPQLDQYAQQAFKEGYLCAKEKRNCPVPENLNPEELKQLEKGKGYYFDAKPYVNKKSTTKDYYTGLMTGTYACTSKNLELLKKFVYEQQWKTGILYEN